MARPVGVEPTTCGLEVRCSIQLSYERLCFGGFAPKPPLALSELIH